MSSYLAQLPAEPRLLANSNATSLGHLIYRERIKDRLSGLQSELKMDFDQLSEILQSVQEKGGMQTLEQRQIT